jgi:hypothetical protein
MPHVVETLIHSVPNTAVIIVMCRLSDHQIGGLFQIISRDVTQMQSDLHRL